MPLAVGSQGGDASAFLGTPDRGVQGAHRRARPRGGRVEGQAPPQPDNHWLDGTVGCAVAASIQGVVLPGTESREPKVRQRVKLSEIRKTRGR